MKKLIFRKFNQDTLVFFSTSLLIMGLIVWTLQAVNYFDFVTKDGHGLKVYFIYTFLSFPKIIHRILPFMFFVSLFYTIINYELKNEINIFWINGISKIDFANKLIFISIILMFFQIFLGAYVSPTTQFKARNYLKNSNIDFFTSLIKEGKFLNVAKDLTIFIEKKNEDGSYTDIFLDDSTKSTSKMIYAKNGTLIDNEKQKIFKLKNGKVINNEDSKINVFEFEQIDFNLNDLDSNTVKVPKIQEIDSITLLSCFFNVQGGEFESFTCSENVAKEIKQELLKRFYKPLYIPIIAILCCFLLIYSKNKINYNKNKNFVFVLIFVLLIISEGSLRYSVTTYYSLLIYLMLPWLIFIFAYLIFYRIAQNV